MLTINDNDNNVNQNQADGTGFSVNRVPHLGQHQNVHFVDGDTAWSYDIGASPDSTFDMVNFTDAQLSNFLSRPVKIQQYSWTPGASLFQSFNPWTNFFSDTDVLEKINRYRNLRCNLRLKVLINGNSFYYGRLILDYNPYTLNDNITRNRAFFIQDIVQSSQKPHILLDPTTSQGGELCLPYIWPENYLNITTASWEDDMGYCTLRDFDVLHHANGGTDPITITIFAWAENLRLVVPTNTQAQAGRVHNVPLDEYGFPVPYEEQAGGRGRKSRSNIDSDHEFSSNGLISKPASALSKFASSLTMVPIISPYAKATSLIAGAIGNVAKIFGYSRPQVLHDTISYVPRFMGNLCNTDAPEPLIKLSVDSKNELTIDTRVMGLSGADELTIHSIASRMSFWRQFDWPEAAVTDTLLTSIKVLPSYVRTLSASPVLEFHPTAIAFAASPFDCWQGSIKFRFNVICSEYHRGRLRLVYNPSTLSAGAISFNRVYSTIIDIAEERDFEYEVKWADVRAWAPVLPIGSVTEADLYDDVNPVVSGAGTDNGSLSVYVVNELATPSTTAADVKIQVWVGAGDDFALSVPTQANMQDLSVYQEQSEVVPDIMASTADQSNAPTEPSGIPDFGSSSIPDDNQYLVYQGERIVSFRDLLRRYQYYYSYWPAAIGTSTLNRIVKIRKSVFPYYRGWDPNGTDLGLDSVLANSPYTFSSMTLLNYLTPAFACRRGSLRHKVLYTNISIPTDNSLAVTRTGVGGATNSNTFYSVNNSVIGDRRSAVANSPRADLSGTVVTPTRVNPCLEYETPFYTYGQRFVPARQITFTSGVIPTEELSLDIPANTASTSYRLDCYISTGEDFQLGMFTGAPILFAYADPTAT